MQTKKFGELKSSDAGKYFKWFPRVFDFKPVMADNDCVLYKLVYVGETGDDKNEIRIIAIKSFTKEPHTNSQSIQWANYESLHKRVVNLLDENEIQKLLEK